GDDREAGAVQRLGDGGELGDHVLAVRALLEHAGDGAQLALGALESVDHGSHVGGIEFHEVLLGVGGQHPDAITPGVYCVPPGVYAMLDEHTARAPPPHRLAAPGGWSRAVAPTPASRDLRARAARRCDDMTTASPRAQEDPCFSNGSTTRTCPRPAI